MYGSSPMRGNRLSPEHLDRKGPGQRLQVELDRLRAARQVADHQHLLLTERSQVRQHPMIRRFQERRSCRG